MKKNKKRHVILQYPDTHTKIKNTIAVRIKKIQHPLNKYRKTFSTQCKYKTLIHTKRDIINLKKFRPTDLFSVIFRYLIQYAKH